MMRFVKCFFGPLTTAILISIPAASLAAAVWTGATDNDWRTDANWTPTDWPGNDYGDSNDEAVFDVGTTGNVSPNITDNHVYPKTIQITGTGSTSYTFTGDRQLVIKADGGVTVDSSVATDQTFTVMVRPDNGMTTYTNNGSGILEFRTMQAYWSPGSLNAHVVFDGTGAITAGRMQNRDSNRTMSVAKQGTGTLLFSGDNTYTGNTTVERGTLQIGEGGTSGTLGDNSDTFVAAGAVLEINRTDQWGYQYGGKLSGSGTVVIPADGRRFDFDVAQPDSGNLAFVVDGRLASRTNDEVRLGELSGSGVLARGGSTADPIYVVGGKNTDSTFAGTIESNVNLRKVGDGTLTLGGNSTYTGGTTIEAGTLLVNNTAGSGTGSGAVAVTGGTLGGTGTIGGDTTIAGGGTLSPGESIGMLTFAPGAGLTLDAGAAIDWEFDKPGTPGIDYDSITGDALYLPETGPVELSIFGPSANLKPGDSFTLFDGDVYDHNSTLFAAGHVFEDLFSINDHSGWWGTWEVSVDSLILTAVPEPGTCLLLLSALACGLLWRRRR